MQQTIFDPVLGRLATIFTHPGIQGTAVSVPTGAGYVDVQTTHQLMNTTNQSAVVRWWVEHNQALASNITRGGWIEVLVAVQNTGLNATIQSTLTGIAAAGPVPVLTGYLVTGVGWRVSFDLIRTATLSILQDAAIARSVQARYWYGCQDTQVAP